MSDKSRPADGSKSGVDRRTFVTQVAGASLAAAASARPAWGTAAADRVRIRANVEGSLMLVTALVPALGYDRAAEIAHRALRDGTTLREEALKAGVDAKLFDSTVKPELMLGPA